MYASGGKVSEYCSKSMKHGGGGGGRRAGCLIPRLLRRLRTSTSASFSPSMHHLPPSPPLLHRPRLPCLPTLFHLPRSSPLSRPYSSHLSHNSHPPLTPLTVAVDIDEVLGSFLMALNAFVSEEYRCHHHISEFHVYDFTEVWQCSRAEADRRVHSFFKSKHFDSGILPIPGAYQSLSQMTSFCELFVVTSRQNAIKEETLTWINRHYCGIFKDVHFGNHFALEGEARRKSEICRGVGAQILIDDNPKYAMDCAENGIEVLLFDWNNSYPWSKTQCGPQHPLITRVHNWQEVESELKGRLTNSKN